MSECQHTSRRQWQPTYSVGDESDYESKCRDCGALTRMPPNPKPSPSCASIQAELSACREQLDEALQSAMREVARLETEAMERSAACASLQAELERVRGDVSRLTAELAAARTAVMESCPVPHEQWEPHTTEALIRTRFVTVEAHNQIVDRLAAAEATIASLSEALKVADMYFRRNQASGNFHGDDEHEAWTAASTALASLPSSPVSPREEER